MEHRRKNQDGFTLIELLVVISVISLLMAILMPSLTKARDRAKRIVCASKLRQLGIAIFVYANDWDDVIWQPSNAGYTFYPSDSAGGGWGALYPGYLQSPAKLFFCPNEKRKIPVPGWDAADPNSQDISYTWRRSSEYGLGFEGRQYYRGPLIPFGSARTWAFLADRWEYNMLVRDGGFPTSHEDGYNVFYTDGHSAWFNKYFRAFYGTATEPGGFEFIDMNGKNWDYARYPERIEY